MNPKTHFTLSFYHLSLAIRDTLEYVQNRKEYPASVWQAKRRTIELSLKENSPFDGFCKNNGEVGLKIREQLKDFYDTVYGDDATFISLEASQVKPDHAQNLKVLDYILPLKQSLTNILRAYIVDQKKDNSLEDGVEEIVNLEDRFYRAIVSMVIADLLFNVEFAEFNNVMRQNQGKETPQSNFVVNDIKKLISMYNFVKQNSQPDDEEYKAACEGMEKCIRLISAQEKVPEGSSFKQEFDLAIQGFYKIVAELEPVWREKHTVIWNELVEFEKNAQQSKLGEAK